MAAEPGATTRPTPTTTARRAPRRSWPTPRTCSTAPPGSKLSLATDDDPDTDAFLRSAAGTIIADPPAFEGSPSARFQGFDASDIGIISVDGTFRVDVPLAGWQEFDPSDLCAPDPALLLDPDSGVSSVLTASEGLEEGDSERGGPDNQEVLTAYTGSVPGDAIINILPCAPGDAFDAKFTINADGYLRQAELTGEFFGGGGDITYTIDIDEYDVDEEHLCPMSGADASSERRSRALLVFCSVAVAFAAVDTYVVVLALPEMMASAGIGVDQLQRAAPIISGFLLGYVAVLPLIGRIADLRGPVPVLTASLGSFAVGSLITAAAYDLPSMVAGRFLQGLGGGGLVPATIALVAALYPVERRGLPLGLVSAVQELGAVLGPLFGAAVLSFTSWRGIFAINLAVALLLLVVVRTLHEQDAGQLPLGRPGRFDWLAPGGAAGDVRRGCPDVPAATLDGQRPDLGSAVHPGRERAGSVALPDRSGGGRGLRGAVPAVRLRPASTARRARLAAQHGEADLVGALALGAVLAGIVLAFATADPEVAVFSPQGPWFLLASGSRWSRSCVHLRRAPRPLVPRGALRPDRPGDRWSSACSSAGR